MYFATVSRYLFESNVRDFMGLNRVNEDIKATLENSASPDFWWLNNGVTILATSAAITGKSIQLADIQIVNGLQTTESIFRHFKDAEPALDDRCVLVKVIVSSDAAIRDAIIRATNNQTDVELASLHATDKIQRDIEDVLLRNGLYYERRKNYYANQGHTPAELFTPLYAAAGYVALVLKAPHKAASLRSKFMRSPESYEAVFNARAPLTVWPKIVHILKRIDAELESLRPIEKVTDRFLKGWRYVTALLLVSKAFGKFTFSPQELADFDPTLVTGSAVEAVWLELNCSATPSKKMGGWASLNNVLHAYKVYAAKYEITGIRALAKNPLNAFRRHPPAREPITKEFIEQVRSALPPQPWKPGIHRKISAQLKCDVSDYFTATELLIEEGAFFRQQDGVLCDGDGNVISFDPERVNPETLELLPEKT